MFRAIWNHFTGAQKFVLIFLGIPAMAYCDTWIDYSKVPEWWVEVPPATQEVTAAAAAPAGWSLPGPPDAVGHLLDRPHHDYPAIDIGVPTGTPVFAVRGGVVTQVHSDGSCGIGVTITDRTGAQWTYCHGSKQMSATGATVAPGQTIMASGNTGASTGPHLHIQIRAEGSYRCPQRLFASLRTSGPGINPRGLPTSGCTS